MRKGQLLFLPVPLIPVAKAAMHLSSAVGHGLADKRAGRMRTELSGSVRLWPVLKERKKEMAHQP
jgi:hypothetical protein